MCDEADRAGLECFVRSALVLELLVPGPTGKDVSHNNANTNTFYVLLLRKRLASESVLSGERLRLWLATDLCE